MTPDPLQLVIFDCDGVLVDSEGPSNRVVAEEVTRLGWPMTAEESLARFVGSSLSSMGPIIEAHTGRPVPPGWVDHVVARLVDVLGRELQPVPGAADLLRAVNSSFLVQTFPSANPFGFNGRFAYVRMTYRF